MSYMPVDRINAAIDRLVTAVRDRLGPQEYIARRAALWSEIHGWDLHMGMFREPPYMIGYADGESVHSGKRRLNINEAPPPFSEQAAVKVAVVILNEAAAPAPSEGESDG